MTQCIRDVITAPYYALNAVNTYRKKKDSATHNKPSKYCSKNQKSGYTAF